MNGRRHLAIRETLTDFHLCPLSAGALGSKATRKAALGLAAAATLSPAQAADQPARTPATGSDATAQGDHLTTTFHHPFSDETQAAVVEAEDLHEGGVLQTPTDMA